MFRNIFDFHEKIEDKIKAHIGYNICLLILSILIGAFYQYINHNNILLGKNPDYVNTVLFYISQGLFLLSIIMIFRETKLLRNKDLMRKISISETDERNRLISMKSYAYTCKSSIIGCFVAALITAFNNMYLSKSLFIVGCCLMLVVFLINRFLQHRM